jgi:hypothetical protein
LGSNGSVGRCCVISGDVDGSHDNDVGGGGWVGREMGAGMGWLVFGVER